MRSLQDLHTLQDIRRAPFAQSFWISHWEWISVYDLLELPKILFVPICLTALHRRLVLGHSLFEAFVGIDI